MGAVTEPWEDTHLDDFQYMSAVLLPGRFDEETCERLHEMGRKVTKLHHEGKLLRHGSDLHFKFYCHVDGYCHDEDPELVQVLRDAMEKADEGQWRLVAQEKERGTPVSVRLLEYHTYLEGGDLTKGFHKHYDGGSLLTMVSSPSS